MARTLTERRVVTRKPHRCQACGVESPKGARMDYVVNIDNGTFMAFHFCLVCVEFMGTLPWNDIEEGFDGDIWEWDGYSEFRAARQPTVASAREVRPSAA